MAEVQKIDPTRLGDGTRDGTKFLRDDQTWQPSPGGGVTDHGALTGLGDDDHTQYALADGSRGTFEVAGAVASHEAAADPHTGYQKESEKDLAGGYAGVDGNVTVALARGIRETGGAALGIGAIAVGETLVRSGSNIVGSAGGGGLSHPQVLARSLGS